MSIGKILIVDDSRTARMRLRNVLARLGATEIEEAENGAEGIAKFKAAPPQVLFLDIEMPEMTGLEAVGKIGPIKGRAKIFMLTSVDNPDVIDECILAGADDYVRKDRSDAELEARIKSELGL